jgi:hypothetical protein
MRPSNNRGLEENSINRTIQTSRFRNKQYKRPGALMGKTEKEEMSVYKTAINKRQ